MVKPAQRPEQAEVTEVLDKPSANVPAKLTKLASAMDQVGAKMAVIQQFGSDVVTLIAENPADRIYDLSMPKFAKAADEVRKLARTKRLAIKTAWDEGKTIIKGLNDELKTAAETDIGKLQAIENNVKAQQDAQGKAEEDRKQRHLDAIAAIGQMSEGVATLGSNAIEAKMDAADKVIVDGSYEEYEKPATTKLAEVKSVLVDALAAAQAREEAARIDTKARAAIDAMKALPAGAEGTDIDNVRELLRIHNAHVPSGETFGVLLETAELWHFKVGADLQAMIDGLEARAPEAEGLDADEPAPDTATAPLFEDGPLPGSDAKAAALKTAMTQAEEQFGAGAQWTEADMAAMDKTEPPLEFNKAPPWEDDPFSKPPPVVTATTHTAPAPRPPMRPALRTVTTPAAAAITEFFVPDDDPKGIGMGLGQFPAKAEDMAPLYNLLKCAQDFITTAEEAGGTIPAKWTNAYLALRKIVRELSK